MRETGDDVKLTR